MINYGIEKFVKRVAVHHHYVIPITRSYPSWVDLDTKTAPMKVCNEKFITLMLSRSDDNIISRKDDSWSSKSYQEDNKSSV